MICRWGHSATQVDRCHTDSNTVLSVIDSTAIGEDVDVGAFRSELAVALQAWNNICQSVSPVNKTQQAQVPNSNPNPSETHFCEVFAHILGGCT